MAAPCGQRKPVWSADSEIALIEFFESNPCLWDPRDVGYVSRQFREERLLDLCKLLNSSVKSGAQFTPKDCKERFKNLRTTFHREYKKDTTVDSNRRTPGAEMRMPRWVHYARMMFLSRTRRPATAAAVILTKPDSCSSGGEDQNSEGSDGEGAGFGKKDPRSSAACATQCTTDPGEGRSDANGRDSCGDGSGSGSFGHLPGADASEASPPSPDRPLAARPIRLAASSSRKRRKLAEPAYSPLEETPGSAAAIAVANGQPSASAAVAAIAATAVPTLPTSSAVHAMHAGRCNGDAVGAGAAPCVGTVIGGNSACCCCCTLRQSCDVDEAFGRYVCASLKQMPQHVRCLAKLEIQRSITQFETEASSSAPGGAQLGGGHGSFYPL